MTELLQMMKFKEINIKKTMMLKIYLIHRVNREIFKIRLLAGMHSSITRLAGQPLVPHITGHRLSIKKLVSILFCAENT